MITENIAKQIQEAMKAKDEVKLSTLRMLSSALNYEFIAKQHKLSEEEELAVVRHEVKQRNDAIEAYKKAGANDRAEKEAAEKKILEEYLPAQMPDSDLEKIVDEAINNFKEDLPADATHQALQAGMGKVIGMVMGKAGGKADGSKVAGLVKQKLNG